GVSTALDATNHPVDVAPSESGGDPITRRSSNADSGTSWTTGMGSAVQLNSTTANTSRSSAVIPLSTGNILAFYDDGANSTTFTNVLVSQWNGTSWTPTNPGTSVFTAITAEDGDSWCAVRRTDTEVHVVLASGTNTFTHKLLNGTTVS